MNNVKKNFVYNFMYQVLILIIPLVTMPYVSRKIGSIGIGTYSYTYSIVYYFMMFAMLGLNNYGNRTIAKLNQNKEALSRAFKEIHLLQIITSSVMIVIYLLFIFLVKKDYFDIFLFQAFYLISCMFDINWFFFGMEQFKITVTRNTIIKVLSLVFIFAFVKCSDDIWKYTLILSFSTLLSQLFLWPFVRKFTVSVKVSFQDMKKHFVPCLKLFLPVIAVAIYKVMDKTMLGLFSNISEVGFYENAEKIINVPLTIITALGTVMLPRSSHMIANGEDDKLKVIIEKSLSFIMFLAFAMFFGLIAISHDFTILFFGEEFRKSGVLIILLAITLLFLSWGNVIRTQFLIPKERDKEYIISAFLGAFINVVMNLIFIPSYGSIGACIGTVFAEFSVMLYQTIVVINDLTIKKYLFNIFPFFVKSFLMFLCIYFLKFLDIAPFIQILFQIILGCVIYFLLNVKYIRNNINFNKIFHRM